MNKSSHSVNGQTNTLTVCKTLKDVHEAKKKYVTERRLKLSLRHCVFQGKYTKNKDAEQ